MAFSLLACEGIGFLFFVFTQSPTLFVYIPIFVHLTTGKLTFQFSFLFFFFFWCTKRLECYFVISLTFQFFSYKAFLSTLKYYKVYFHPYTKLSIATYIHICIYIYIYIYVSIYILAMLYFKKFFGCTVKLMGS